MKQPEQHNSIFPDTLMGIRDLSAYGKHEFQKLKKDLDLKKKNEFDELASTKQKLSAIVEDMEHHIADLQEQLQQELQHVKQEARETVEARDAHAEEMADLAEWNANSTSITLSP